MSYCLAIQVKRLKKRLKYYAEVTKELEYFSEYDMLSGLKNRNAFIRVTRTLDSSNVLVLVCDIDNLKLTNDTLGHWAGDQLIHKTAEILKTVCPLNTDLFRMGGDEFLALISSEGCTREQITKALQEQIHLYNHGSEGLPLSLSVGLATSKDGIDSLFDVIKQADRAMYQKKRGDQKKDKQNPNNYVIEMGCTND